MQMDFWWRQFYDLQAILLRGDPPLLTQLMVVNTIFLIVYILRRIRGVRPLRTQTATTIQVMLLFANATIVILGDTLPRELSHLL